MLYHVTIYDRYGRCCGRHWTTAKTMDSLVRKLVYSGYFLAGYHCTVNVDDRRGHPITQFSIIV